MIEVQLTTFAKARVWFGPATSGLIPSAGLIRRVAASLTADMRVSQSRITLEAWVPRGARMEYGLLGMIFVPAAEGFLQIEVPASSDDGERWAGSLAGDLDDVRLGLPTNYAYGTIEATALACEGRFPAGVLSVVEAAHGSLGSSVRFFSRIATAILALMLECDQASLAADLRGKLVDT